MRIDYLKGMHQLDEATLQKMSYSELVLLEDDLLLKNELNSTMRIRFTAGRFVLLVLGAILWGLTFLPGIFWIRTIHRELQGLASFAWVFISLGIAAVLVGKVWRSIGVAPRMIIRYSVHYWPVLFFLASTVLIAVRSH